MNKEFIPYEQALELKELGFDEPCYYDYNFGGEITNKWAIGLVPAPIYQQAFRWFREKHGLFGCIDLQVCNPPHWFIRIDKIEINDYLYHSEDENIQYNTYEDAQLNCIKQLIKTIKEVNEDKVGEYFAKNADIKIEIVKNK
jgi:hypothetical protein